MNNHPAYHVSLTPHAGGRAISRMDVEVRLGLGGKKAGERLFYLHMETVRVIPFCELVQPMEIRDALGAVPVETEEEYVNPIKRLYYKAGRDISGELVLRYTVLPRVQPEGYRSSPYFDLVCEQGGMNGSGLVFLPMAEIEGKCSFRLRWDLSDMPAGTRGVWALGEGDVSAEVSVQDILYSYYAVGVMNSLCEKNVGIYWFGSTPFPIEETAQNVNRLVLHMAEKFEDEGLPYKIFLRANGFPSGGGTAVFRSYMLGYSNDGNDAPSGKSLIHLFAHEMVHNWPHIEDEPYGSGNWYAEGTAQFYCSMLPYRLGMTSIDELCREVQLNADYLYRNPTRDMPAMEAAKLFWTDRRTQRLPYGRGFIYLANVDAEVREATGGRECLDDLCRTVLRRQRKGEKIGNEEWIGVIAAYVGEERARREHTEMMDGTVIAPRADAFDGLLEVHEAEVTLDAMLTDEQSIGKAETSQEKAMGWIWTVKK